MPVDDVAVGSVAVNGTSLAYVDSGAGEPVVAVHGALSDMRIWRPYAPTLAADKRFIALTQRYFGPGAWPDAATYFSRQTHIADLIGFVEALAAGPVHLVTWSYGGEIGFYAMQNRPDLFRSAMHFEPSLGALLTGIAGGAEAQADFLASLEPALAALKAGRVDDAGFRFLEAVFHLPPGGAWLEPEAMRAYVKDNARTLAPFLRPESAPPLSDADLAVIDAPVSIVHGEHSHVRYKLIAERLVAGLPNARLEIMPGVNHDGPYRDPSAFADLIRRFHTGLDRA